jgi:hypothetical protein
MMRRVGGRVQIDLSKEDWNWLLLILGHAWAAAQSKGSGIIDGDTVLRLANVINEGNPDYTPYVAAEKTE